MVEHTTKFHFVPYGRLDCFPWNDPAAREDMGVMPGAATLWGLNGTDDAVLFHTTTAAAADEIMRNGPKPSEAIEVGGHPSMGIAGRAMPAGFWASARPTVPNSSDTWMPNVAEHPWTVLMVKVPRSALRDAYVYEPTWPVPQFCLHIDYIEDVAVIEPADMPRFIHPETIQLISEYRSEEHLSSPYLDAIDRAVGKRRGFGKEQG